MRLNKTLNVRTRLGKRAYGLYSRTRARDRVGHRLYYVFYMLVATV